jgi:antitoxin component of MazEF toxin-antitoxin module
MTPPVRVPPVSVMVDETLIKHLELRHGNDLTLQLSASPRGLAAPVEWRTYHETMHRLNPADYDHEHNEE